MPRIRSIKPKFWDDAKLGKVSRDVRLLFIGTWTFADDLGVIMSDPIWLKSKIFPYDKLEVGELEKWIEDLVLNKFVIPISYRNENFFVIRNFDKHQRINKPNNDDIFIDNEQVKNLLEQSRNNHGIITEQSVNDIVSITGGEERIGEERIGEERIGEDKDRIGKECDFSEKKYLVPEMQNIWKKYKPAYPADKTKDFPALQSIAVFICENSGINYNARGSTDDKNLYELWGTISKFVSTHDFFKNYSLHQVEKHIQSITQEIKNGKSGYKNGQPANGKVNGEQLNEAFTNFYSQSK